MTPWFEASPESFAQLRKELRYAFPTFHAHVRDNVVILEGTLPLMAEEGSVIDRYSLQINLPDNYPKSLPSVWEIAGRIPREIDRHVFPGTEALCLGYPAELWLRLEGDFRVENYIRKAIVPYLIGNSLVEEGEPWPFNERTHGSAGALEFFAAHLGTNDPRAIGRLLLGLIKGRVRGHWMCPCASGQIVRKCHRPQIEGLRTMPRQLLQMSLEAMVALIEAQRH